MFGNCWLTIIKFLVCSVRFNLWSCREEIEDVIHSWEVEVDIDDVVDFFPKAGRANCWLNNIFWEDINECLHNACHTLSLTCEHHFILAAVGTTARIRTEALNTVSRGLVEKVVVGASYLFYPTVTFAAFISPNSWSISNEYFVWPGRSRPSRHLFLESPPSKAKGGGEGSYGCFYGQGNSLPGHSHDSIAGFRVLSPRTSERSLKLTRRLEITVCWALKVSKLSVSSTSPLSCATRTSSSSFNSCQRRKMKWNLKFFQLRKMANFLLFYQKC